MRSVLQKPAAGSNITCRLLKPTDNNMTSLCRRFSALTFDRTNAVVTGQPLHEPYVRECDLSVCSTLSCLFIPRLN